MKPNGQVTLDDVLRLALPLNTIVTGGEATGCLVTWVTVLTEANHLQDQVQGGDIVILPAPLQAQLGEKKLAQILPALARIQAAALLTLCPVSAEVAAAAAANQLPILVVSGDATLRQVHQGIAGLLANRQKQIAERGLQLYRRLTEMSREGRGLVPMTEVMSRLTGKIVAVQDKRLEIQALIIPDGRTVDSASLHRVLTQSDHLPPVLRNRKAAANTPQSHWQQLLPVGDGHMARLISPIISGDRARGYVSVIGRPDELDMLDTVTVEQGAAACALEMAKAKAISEVKKELRGDFLEGLLAGKLTGEEIQRLAGRLDHDTDRRHAILVMAWAGVNTPSLRRLETPLNWLLSSHKRPALTHIHGAEHVCVFQALEDGDDDLTSAVELTRRLREHLRAEFPHDRLLCGLSGPARNLSDWPEVYQQALQAMDLARRLRLYETVDFNGLGVYQLLTELEHLPAVQRFNQHMVGPLVQYDKEHGSNLIQTLDAYFDHHGNVSQTAEALYIHRNTLHYRLERIQELTGQNLDLADQRLALQLALKLWQLRPGS